MISVGCRREAYVTRDASDHVQPEAAFMRLASCPRPGGRKRWRRRIGDVDKKGILPDLEAPHFDTYFVYPEELRSSKRIDVFRDFLLQQARQFGYSPRNSGVAESHAENA